MTVEMPPEIMLRPGKLRDQILDFKHKVEWVTEPTPELVCTSWFRDPVRNAEAGGAIGSQHQLALATDWDWIGADLDYYKRIGQRGLQKDLTSVIYWTGAKSYIHFQYLAADMDTQPFVFLFNPKQQYGWYIDLAVMIWKRLRAPEATSTVKLE
jgi:hypothetical protein